MDDDASSVLGAGLPQESLGLVAAASVALFLAVNRQVAARYVRPANLASTELDPVESAKIANAIVANATGTSFAAERREFGRLAKGTARWRKAIELIWKRGTSEPERFTLHPIHQMPGLTA